MMTRLVSGPLAVEGACRIAAQLSLKSLQTSPDHSRSKSAPAPAAIDMSCLNGVRAVGSILVVLFHCYCIWLAMVPDTETALQLVRSNWLVSLAAVGGPVAVDFFLVITATLAAYQLLPRLEDRRPGSPSCLAVALRYLRGRARRLLPAYAVTLLLIWLVPSPTELAPEVAIARGFSFGRCPAGLWTNLLFVSNLQGLTSCGVHLWSLALQVQFYVAFPLLLCALRPRAPGFRARLAATLAALGLAGTAWRLWAAYAADFQLPTRDWGDNYVALLNPTYFTSETRVAELALGAALGLLLRSPKALGWLQSRRHLVAGAALGLQAGGLHLLTNWSQFGLPGEAAWGHHTTKLFASLLYYGSPFAAATVAASLLALFTRADALHAGAASILSFRRLQPLADWSYGLYLILEQARWPAMMALLPAGLLPALVAAAPVLGLLLFQAFSLAAGYCCAILLHIGVEKRF